MNQLVVTLAIILLPGIVAAVISDKITVHSKWTPFKFILYAFVLGVFSYTLLQIVYFALDIIGKSEETPISWTYLQVWSNAVADKPRIPGWEVVFAVGFSIPAALVAAFLVNYKVFNKIAQKIGVSSKYGDENLYSYYLNAKEVDWVYIRDIPNNLTYQGRVVSYSENDDIQELVLSEVTIFRYEDSSELYSVPTIYLCKPMGSFIVESIPLELLGESNGEKTAN